MKISINLLFISMINLMNSEGIDNNCLYVRGFSYSIGVTHPAIFAVKLRLTRKFL